MRFLVLVPVLLATLACGSGRQLSHSEAERDIRKDYPVVVYLRIPGQAQAAPGSPDHARLLRLQEQLTHKGWFTVDRKSEGGMERFQFKPTAAAPKELRTAPKGYELPAAQAEFVKALRKESTRDGARITYQIRLEKPTAHFGVFQAVNPEARVGATKERHAMYRKEGRDWILGETDEAFRKAE